jgi:hypothetical protein
MAKTSTERSRERRERLRRDEVERCEVYAHRTLHERIKAYAEREHRKLMRRLAK